VLQVLRELDMPEEMLTQRYIEVWNKVDLVSEENEEAF
jgi:50S ribosomal subunit-associated GTPase HflX